MSDIIETAKRVLALSERATPGPWRRETRGLDICDLSMVAPAVNVLTVGGFFLDTCDVEVARLRVGVDYNAVSNFAAIAAYRTDAPELAAYVAAVAPLVERLRVLGDAVCNDHRPTCESASYGSGCHGPADEDVSFWRAAFALLAADAAARGGA